MHHVITRQPVTSMLDAIGNTPLVKLRKVADPESADVYVKLEYYNPTGSYKDRMALAMIEEAEKRGDLRPGMTVVEYTGGQHRLVAGLCLRGEGLPAEDCFVGCLCPRETADDDSLWRRVDAGAE